MYISKAEKEKMIYGHSTEIRDKIPGVAAMEIVWLRSSFDKESAIQLPARS